MYPMATQLSSHLFQFSRHRLEFLICRNTVSIDIAASDCVLSLLAGVA